MKKLSTLNTKLLAMVPEYPLNGTFLEKMLAVDKEIDRREDAFSKSLTNEKVSRSRQEVSAIMQKAIIPVSLKLNHLSQEYIIKTNQAIKDMSNDSMTLAEELKVRQALDNAYYNYESSNPPNRVTYTNTFVGEWSATKAIEALFHCAIREALTNDIACHAKSTDVDGFLEISELQELKKILVEKAKAEAPTGWQRYFQYIFSIPPYDN
jgi:hypothetical protein